MSRARLRIAGAAVALVLLAALALPRLTGAATAATPAPEIARPGLKWFNVAQPLPIASLRGRIVILDFWTEGCINCIHIIPILRRIEERYPEQVAVIGVHSPKFAEEKSTASVEDAIRRYEIHHPIVHDPEMTIWRDYGVEAWPTLVLIAPDGSVLTRLAGEPDPARFATAIDTLVAEAGKAGALKPERLALQIEAPPQGRFLFPGKLKPAPGPSHEWLLADAGHNQIVLLDDAGKDLRRYGSGAAGLVDGAAADARFDHPQGLIATADAVFVADTGNHAIRRIDRKSGAVSTLAGNGQRGTTLKDAAQPARSTALASPWDLETDGGKHIYFANAGTHQIGVLDPDAATVSRFAGSGAEDLIAGTFDRAAFAQPSGLALSDDSKTLYVADSESSAIRAIAIADRSTKTLVGAGLFDFGKTNGAFGTARLQHPLGVAAGGAELLVADTYNSRIRTLDLTRQSVTDFDGGKFTCTDPICYPLREPAGIAIAGKDRILLVDTGNQRVEEYRPSLKTSRTWAR